MLFKIYIKQSGKFVSNMMNVKFTGIKVDIDPKLYNIDSTKMIEKN